MRLLLLVFATCYITNTFGQNCPALTGGTEPVNGLLGYQSRNGHHCEGLVTLTNSAGVDIDIISFTKGGLNYLADPREKLTIENLLPVNVPLSIRGRNFNMYAHYRLDMDIRGRDSVVIPAATVIAKAHIAKDNMGIYAYGKLGQKTIYSPVRIVSEIAGRSADSLYTLCLLKNVTFKAMEYRYARCKNNDPGKYSAPIIVTEKQITGDKVKLVLPPDMKNGTFLITVYYTLSSNYPSKADFYLRIP